MLIGIGGRWQGDGGRVPRSYVYQDLEFSSMPLYVRLISLEYSSQTR
jgi:hypothetical protein